MCATQNKQNTLGYQYNDHEQTQTLGPNENENHAVTVEYTKLKVDYTSHSEQAAFKNDCYPYQLVGTIKPSGITDSCWSFGARVCQLPSWKEQGGRQMRLRLD